MALSPKAALVEGPVGLSLLRMAGPMTLGLFMNMLFNLVDTYFIGLLGHRELTAMGFTFPLVFFVTGSAMGMGIGVASCVSRAIGRGETERVKRLVTDSILLALLLVGLLVGAGLWGMDRVFLAMGAEEELLPLIRAYMVPLLSGIAFLVVPMVGNNAIRATGDTLRPMVIMLFAGVTNALLDPLFIFGWGPVPAMGVRGAALATVGAYALAFLAMLFLLGARYRLLTFRLGSLAAVLGSWKEVLVVALPAMLTNQMIPVANGVLTALVARHGGEAVAGWGVGIRLESLMMAPFFAMSVVMGPFVGQNHGARKAGRIREALRFTGFYCLGLALLIWAAAAAAAPFIAARFSDNPHTLRVIQLYLWIVPASYGVFGWKLQFTSAFNARRMPLHSSAVFLLRFFAFIIPLAHAGNAFLGLPGLFAGIALGNLLACLSAIGLHLRAFH